MKKSRGSSNLMSAEAIGGSESILTLIFLLLPVKSLVSFKVVCKQWLSLISDPYFANRHTITSIERNPDFLSPSGFFICNSFDNQIHSYSLSKKRVRKPPLPCLSFLGQDLKVLQSRNGLLLCRLGSGLYCVCNPTTGKFNIFPSAKVDGEFSWISPYTLAFDPSRSSNYRVVCFKRFKNETSNYYLQIFMYLSETSSWEGSTCFEANMCSDMAAGIYSNGAIHWACHEQYICFDIKEGKVRLIRLPFIYFGDHQMSWQIGCLWQWRDTVYSVLTDDMTCNLHELEDQDEFKWIQQKYNMTYYRVSRIVIHAIAKRDGTERSRYNRNERKFSVIGFVKGDNEKDTVILMAVFGKVISFNFARRKVKIIIDLGLPVENEGDICSNCLTAYQYIQTLSPV